MSFKEVRLGPLVLTRDSLTWWGVIACAVITQLALFDNQTLIDDYGFSLLWTQRLRLASAIIGIVSAVMVTSPLRGDNDRPAKP